MAKKNWLERFLTPEADRAERRSPERFAAYRWTGSDVVHERVRDISATGVFVVTKERWPIGSQLALTMQREGPMEILPDRRITAYARVVRFGDDGVGFAFVMPSDAHATAWKQLLDTMIAQGQAKDMKGLATMAEGLAFLSRVCPDGGETVAHLVHEGFSSHRVANAINIALHAETLLASLHDSAKARLHPTLLVRIFEDGSNTEEDWLHQLWGGLLISSCSAEGRDLSNLSFVELFGQLTPVPARILTIVCAVAKKVMSDKVLVARPLACKIDEITTATGTRGTQIERELERLASLGLIEKKSADAPVLLPNDEILITPSTLGLELFARCNGHAGSPQTFYTPDSADAGPGLVQRHRSAASAD